MAAESSNLEEMYARLVLEEEEEGGVMVAEKEIQGHKETFVLVGKFLTEKNINFQAMQNVMASLWRPREGMEIHDIGGFKYSFVFYHIMDLHKVIEGGPWSFEQSMLVYEKLNGGEDAQSIVLNGMDIWVQVYDIPTGLISENILRSVGMYIGQYIKTDSNSFDGGWKQYARIRVTLDINKPLKRRMKLKREGGSWSWVNFKYERLGNFCFVCGMLGHVERECSVVYANPGKVIEKAYGVWLRAPNRNVKNNVGARWLRNVDGGWSGIGGGGGKGAMASGSTDDSARFTESAGIVREKEADKGTVVVTARHQEQTDMERDHLNLGRNPEESNVVLEAKRKRIELVPQQLDRGPIEMQTDGPQSNNKDSGLGLNESKNLHGAGSGFQARRVL